MNTDQLAAEAADEIHWAHVKKPDAYEQENIARTRTIIQTAIEKATRELRDELRQEKLALEQMAARFNKHLSESRAAHASESVEVEVFGHKVKARPAQASDLSITSNATRLMKSDRAAHASKQKCTCLDDVFEISPRCKIHGKPAQASESRDCGIY